MMLTITTDRHGDHIVHKAGCRDLPSPRTVDLFWTDDFATVDEAAIALYADMIYEESMTVDDAVAAVHAFPCTKS